MWKIVKKAFEMYISRKKAATDIKILKTTIFPVSWCVSQKTWR